ncbi:hypothetical protein [Enterococcus lemanii]|uniref:Uncharacterized protein n=1 Tax=Enterococcus lemanii TaxID=1159752 RepID=A0ABV9MY31_9ENTE|nr:hypothetical protein [Enterococcus lemanii]MBM7708213.1 hypothetical protein [Enterococcus lemanii]
MDVTTGEPKYGSTAQGYADDSCWSRGQALAKKYTTKKYPKSNGILIEGVYTKPGNHGVNECTLWGDYFYFEALIRLYQAWYSYW